MKMAVFWLVAPCSLVEVYRRFRGANWYLTNTAWGNGGTAQRILNFDSGRK
jgi:hypothetical protein